MEKILWVTSNGRMVGKQADDGLSSVNDYLANGWSVKHISACAMGDSVNCGQAYIVIEKAD